MRRASRALLLVAFGLCLGGCGPQAPAGTEPGEDLAPRLDDASEVLAGRVVGVADGDTLTVLDASRSTTKVRLAGIDAPESSQDFGSRAKQALASKVFEREVRVGVTDQDRYGRAIGDIYLEGRWINEELVREGLAWHYTDYSDDARLARAEREARAEGIGVWSAGAPTAPWDYRRGRRTPPADSELLEEEVGPDTMVFITRTGTKYHRYGCSSLSRSSMPLRLVEARLEYGPCGSCRPPK